MKNLEFGLWKPSRTFLASGLGVILLTGFAPGANAVDGDISATAVQQIAALLQDKASRTPVQRKLDSQLVYAMRMSRGEQVAPGVPTQRLSFTADAAGRVLVDIKAEVTLPLLALIRQGGGEVLSSFVQYKAIRARVPLTQLETVAGSADVVFIGRAVEMQTFLGRLTTEGDATHRAGLGRTNFGVTGLGVKIGVLSDSVDFISSSLATGDLQPVTILPGQSGVGTGEGTAMLEIVADLAPKAQLYFSTANGGPAQFAKNIMDLRALGCDVIVDDVRYFNEAAFQDDVISQAVDAVTASGALYFSSAGNQGNKNDGTSGTFEGDFNGAFTFTVGNNQWLAHGFGNIARNVILGPGLTTLQWADPLGASTNDYDLFVLNAAGTMVTSSSTTPQTGTQDPYENAGFGNVGEGAVVARSSGTNRFFHLNVARGLLTNSTEGEIAGHAAAAAGFGVAAVDVATAFPNPFIGGTPNPVETFSTDGPRRIFYDSAGVALTPGNFSSTGGVVRLKPDIAAADGVMTTVPGFNPFFGTSAAAPHAAAIAALIKSYNPALTPQQIRFALTNTALDIEAPGPDRDSGVGIIMPISALSVVPPPRPTLIASNLTGGNANGIIDVNECNELDLILKNNAITTAASVSGTLITTTPGVFVDIGNSAYPSILPGATAVNVVPFRIYTAPNFVCGTPVDFSFRIASSLGGVTNNFRMASGAVGIFPVQFQSTNAVAIPDNSTNGVDVIIPVNGVFGSLGKVTVAVHALHPADGELTLQLVGPDGTRVTLAAGRGATDANFGLSCAEPTVFDDQATTNIIGAFAPFVGNFRPEQPLSTFNGKANAAVNGNWRLRVIDGQRLNTGSVQCVTISLHPAICTDGGGDCSADVGVTLTDAPDPVLVGSNLTYILSVTNRSPHLAPVTTVIDTLPPGVTVVSLAPSRGSCSASAGLINCALGTLPGNGSAIITINVRPVVAGLITNRVTVTSIATDTNPFDNNAAAVTSVQNPMPIIVPFAASLVSESGPVNGGVDPGETLSIRFYLRNVGTLDTTNLIAKLLPTGGIMDPSEQRNYGTLVAGGLAAAQDYTFQAIGTNAGVITASFQLQEGTNNGSTSLGTITFTFALGGAITIANQGVIRIPDSGATNPYPSTIPVSGLAGVVSKVTVTLSNLNHTFPEDIDALLVSPGGQKVMLMSDSGASVDIVNAVLSFDDAGPALSQAGPIVSGTFRPTDYPPDDVMPAPAPVGPYALAMSALNGFDPNGTWSLYVADDFAGDLGRIAGGWSLSITTFDPVNPQAELAVFVTDSPDPVKLGSNLTYTVTVTNAGPEVALGVMLTNTLPPGMSFVSVDGAGVCTNDSGVVVCDLGILSVSNSAIITIVATATGLGSQSFIAHVAGGVAEFNLADNTATAATAIQANADVAITISANPSPSSVNGSITYTLTVTNHGPNHASGVTVTNVLPAGVIYVDAGPSQGSCSQSGGVVTCFLGTIPSHGEVTVTVIVTTPAGVTPLTDLASVASTSPADPDLANNQASLTTTNLNPAFIIVPAMTFLVYESGPTNGGMDVGETVIINFELRNIGGLPTTNLVGTLLPTGGVTSPEAARTYGVLDPNGVAVGASFTFTAAGTAGALLTATIQLQDGSYNLGTVSFTFALGNMGRYTSTTPASIPVFGPAALYPSTINISGLTGAITKVSVTLSNLVHTYPDDLDILLVGPGGRSAMLMSDAGGGNGVAGLTLTLDDAAASFLSDRFTILAGAYRPTDFDSSDFMPSPAPAGPYQSALETFIGLDPNTTWSLYVYDDTFSDQGQLAGGWSLDITTVGLIDPAPAILAAGRFTPAGQFEFMLKGPVGGKFLIQRSPDMHSWTTIGNALLAPSNSIMFADPAPAGSAPRFYRAVHIP